MCEKYLLTALAAICLVLLISPLNWARDALALDNLSTTKVLIPGDTCPPLEYEYVADCHPEHSIGRIRVGTFENGICPPPPESPNIRDCMTGDILEPLCMEYPLGSGLNYLGSAGFWYGAVYNGDTVVSRFWDIKALWQPTIRSTLDPLSPEYEGAISQQDYTWTSADVNFPEFVHEIPDYDDGLEWPHIPLNLEIIQRSHSWSFDYADDFVLFDTKITNMGNRTIEDLYIGLVSAPDVTYLRTLNVQRDDLCGYLPTYPVHDGCGLVDTLHLTWVADNDGDPADGAFTDVAVRNEIDDWFKSATSVAGVILLDYPSQSAVKPVRFSYNWWANFWGRDPSDWFGFDYGPQQHDTYRDLGTDRLGYPSGDRNRYYYMRNGEIDFDPIFTASISAEDPVWVCPPHEEALTISSGYRFTQLLSFGPYDLDPGAEMHIPWAVVAGQNFHTNPANSDNLPYSPERFYENLDFSDLAANARWAKWIYDSPGYDTDGDGDSGNTQICVKDSAFDGSQWVITSADTFYYCGDGIPDWKAAAPPSPPTFWLTPLPNALHIRFNGERTETEPDVFSRIADFEGYRVYVGRDEREPSYSIVASMDIDDYDKFAFNPISNEGEFVQTGPPLKLDSLRCLYGSSCDDTTFNPLDYTEHAYWVHPDFPDSIFYFEPHGFNICHYPENTPIRRTYPDEPHPSAHPGGNIPPEAYTDDGFLKYYEYELTIENLLPTVPYYVNVTAFDFGDTRVNMEPLETSVTIGAKSAFPLGQSSALAASDDKVYVYPNPYRIDADYRDLGFEGRGIDDRPDYRVRQLNFGNLPSKCKIYIYSLDGDLIRELEHDFDPSDPNCTHDTWNLITRNTQMVVSGLYYWVVEAEDGSTQMGKFVIIM